jgi:hypothetical protein
MGRIYNILFQSSQGTGSIGSRSYYFDWSKFPNGKYKGSFSFITASGTTTVACCNIFCELGQECMSSANTPTGSQLTNGYFYIGSAGVTAIGANRHVYCSAVDNPLFYLLNRPSNNNITIKILQNDAGQSDFTPELAYSLTLSLELLDD